MSDDPRLDYPATRRNREPILGVLREVLPETGVVLEVASGSGQHVAHFAQALPKLRWQPSDRDDELFASIRAWTEALDNVADPLILDAAAPPWPGLDATRIRALTCANMIHISPWESCLGLLAGAGELLSPGDPLVLYGPFMREGAHTAPSNADFDASLRARDPRWGVRDLDTVANEAISRGLELDRIFEMPANNLTVVFRRNSG